MDINRSPERHKTFIYPFQNQNNGKLQELSNKAHIQRSKTSSNIFLKSRSHSDMLDSMATARTRASRKGSQDASQVKTKELELFNEFAGLGGTADDYINHSNTDDSPNAGDDIQKKVNLVTSKPVLPPNSRRQIHKQRLKECNINDSNTPDNVNSYSARDKKLGDTTSRDNSGTRQSSRRDTGDITSRLKKVSHIVSANGNTRRKAAWAVDNNHLLKGAVSSSPLSTPPLRRKRIDIDFTPKFLSSAPSSRQSSANSLNSKDIKIIVYNNINNNQTPPRKQCITESTISKNEKSVDIVDIADVKTYKGAESSISKEKSTDSDVNMTEVQTGDFKNNINPPNMKSNHSNNSYTQNPNEAKSVTSNTIKEQSKQLTLPFPDIVKDNDYLNEELTHEVYMKCVKWLEGLQAVEEESNKCLDVVTLPPIVWND